MSYKNIIKYLKEENVFWEYAEGCNYHPILTSNLHSNIYLNFYNLNKFSKFNKFLNMTGLMEEVKLNINNIDCVCGLPNGGNFFASVIGIFFDIPVVVAEKRNNSYIVKGLKNHYKSLLLVDDVITSGRTLYNFLQEYNSLVYPYIFCLALRMNVASYCYKGIIYNFFCGINISKYSEIYKEEECPMCKKGSKAVSPKEHWDLFIVREKEKEV